MRRLLHLLWPGLLLAAALQLGWATSGNAPDYRDLWEAFVPMRTTVLECWKAAGTFTLWNPHLGCGMPVLSSVLAGLLYPPGWLAILWPGPLSLALVGALHTWMGATTMALFLSSLRLPRGAALTGAVAYAGSGVIAALWAYPQVLAGSAWLPLVLWGADATLRGRGPWPALWGGAALGICVLAGAPHLALMTAILVALLALAHVLGGGAPWWRAALALIGVGVVSVLVAAPQLLPALEILGGSHRAGGLDDSRTSLAWSLRKRDALRMLCPLIWGDGLRVWFGMPFTKPLSFLVGVAPGLGVLALAVGGLRHLRRVEARFALAAVVLFGLLAAAPVLGLGELLLHLPGVSLFRYPIKYLIGMTPAIALLAAHGVQGLRERSGRVVVAATAGALAVALGILGLVLDEQLYLALAGRIERPELWEQARTAAVQQARTWLLVAAASAALMATLLATSRSRSLRVLALLVILAEPVAYSAWIKAPGVPPDREPAVVEVLREELARFPPGQFRVATVCDLRSLAIPHGHDPADAEWRQREFLAFDAAGLYGLPTMNYYWVLRPRRWDRILDIAPPTSEDIDRWRYRLHELAAARFVVTPYRLSQARARQVREVANGVKVWELPGALPRAFVAERVRSFHSLDTLLETLAGPDFDHQREALVEGDVPDALTGAPRAPHREARVVADLADRLELTASGPGLLVLSDSYDPRWQAEVDGQPTPVLPTNGLFRGVVLPPGSHSVTFTYRVGTLRPGLIIAGLTAMLLAAGWFRRRRTTQSGAGSGGRR